MAQHNTHRALGRARTPLTTAHSAARGMGGAAVLGTVLVGSAFTGGAANASDVGLGGDEATSSTSSQSAPASTDQAATLQSDQKLRQGDSNSQVEVLQEALNAHGASLPVTGNFASMTHEAVTTFQADNGLQVDGVVGPETRGALNGDSTGSEQAPASAPAAGGASAPASSSGAGNSIVDAARSAVGTPYSWGGATLGGMDCSGLVNYAYDAAGIDVPRTSGAIAAQGTSISQAEAQPGDLVTWPGHVAIYAGNGEIIDASGSKQQVVEREIWGNPTGFVTYR